MSVGPRHVHAAIYGWAGIYGLYRATRIGGCRSQREAVVSLSVELR